MVLLPRQVSNLSSTCRLTQLSMCTPQMRQMKRRWCSNGQRIHRKPIQCTTPSQTREFSIVVLVMWEELSLKPSVPLKGSSLKDKTTMLSWFQTLVPMELLISRTLTHRFHAQLLAAQVTLRRLPQRPRQQERLSKRVFQMSLLKHPLKMPGKNGRLLTQARLFSLFEDFLKLKTRSD